VDVDISGQIDNVRINGVDIAPLVEAELDRRYPDRATMRPDDATGYREAWDVLERLWQQTVARARRMDPQLLHRRVNGEWSFIETLRHLVFATDFLVNRAILGQPSPWDPLDLRPTNCPTSPASRATGTPGRCRRGMAAPPLRRTRPRHPGTPTRLTSLHRVRTGVVSFASFSRTKPPAEVAFEDEACCVSAVRNSHSKASGRNGSKWNLPHCRW
jgi:DinB superfamily